MNRKRKQKKKFQFSSLFFLFVGIFDYNVYLRLIRRVGGEKKKRKKGKCCWRIFIDPLAAVSRCCRWCDAADAVLFFVADECCFAVVVVFFFLLFLPIVPKKKNQPLFWLAIFYWHFLFGISFSKKKKAPLWSSILNRISAFSVLSCRCQSIPSMEQ